MDGIDRLAQGVPIVTGLAVRHVPRTAHVDAAEVARLVGQQRLLAARDWSPRSGRAAGSDCPG